MTGIETSRGRIRAAKVAIVVAGNSSRLGDMAGLRLPIESHALQAFVSEGVKPLIDHVITFGAGHFYISQSDKGGLVFGGDIDGYNSYAQRGNLPTVEDVCEGGMALMPIIGRLRILRSWGGLVDMSMDGSPIIDHAPVAGIYLNAGWCYGGFKATPGSGFCFAHLIACEAPHPAASELSLGCRGREYANELYAKTGRKIKPEFFELVASAAAVIFTLPKDDTSTGTSRCLKRMGFLRGDKITMRYKRLDMECTRTKKDTAIVVRRGLEQ